jgi:ABC-type transport system involved in multi-copper enzyme maturation permease subunit
VSVYGVLCFGQGVITAFVGTVGLPGPDGGGVVGLGWFEIAIAVGMTCASVAILGLAISGLLSSSEQGMPAVIGVVMTQLVFSGAIIAVNGRAVLEQLSWLAPARWGYAAAASTVDLNRAKETTEGRRRRPVGARPVPPGRPHRRLRPPRLPERAPQREGGRLRT